MLQQERVHYYQAFQCLTCLSNRTQSICRYTSWHSNSNMAKIRMNKMQLHMSTIKSQTLHSHKHLEEHIRHLPSSNNNQRWYVNSSSMHMYGLLGRKIATQLSVSQKQRFLMLINLRDSTYKPTSILAETIIRTVHLIQVYCHRLAWASSISRYIPYLAALNPNCKLQ